MHDRPARPTAFCWNQNCPRVCGEKFRAYAMIWQEWGSPPRMRGKDRGLAEGTFVVGITPAYAGKSPCTCMARGSCRDHPRVCGEKVPAIRRFAQIMGSPPRMRGKGRAARLHHLIDGITPAYAGKSPVCCPAHRFLWDHPRVCGEKCSVKDFVNIDLGSPPHMRGKAEQAALGALERRITPAYAGKSCLHSRVCCCVWDHPRICGEK